jgi:nitrogen fixation NifU-like protein
MPRADADADALASLYREVILAHAARPVGFGKEIDATHECEGSNPLCGDHVTLKLRVCDGVIEAAAFAGESCAICTASTSLLCEHLPGQGTSRLEPLVDGFEAAVQGDEQAACADFLAPMLGVRRYPARLACALLPWRTARKALHNN